MSVMIGIDVGGSTTKIVGFENTIGGKRLIDPIFVRATDPITALYGAFGKFTDQNGIELSDIEIIKVTGVGSAKINKPIYGLECKHESEFECIGRGGLYLSGLDEAIVVSLGTGTALIHAKRGGKIEYLGGTGVGGGTLIGLAKKMLGVQNVEIISALAAEGDLERVDLRIGDITDRELSPTLVMETTAANFGKVSDIATNGDLALGILNLVFETIAMVSIFAARSHGLRDVILTGNLSTIPQAGPLFDKTGGMFGFNFRMPVHAQYATVIGAALTYFDTNGKEGKE